MNKKLGSGSFRVAMITFCQYGTDCQKSNAINHLIPYLRHLRFKLFLFHSRTFVSLVADFSFFCFYVAGINAQSGKQEGDGIQWNVYEIVILCKISWRNPVSCGGVVFFFVYRKAFSFS